MEQGFHGDWLVDQTLALFEEIWNLAIEVCFIQRSASVEQCSSTMNDGEWRSWKLSLFLFSIYKEVVEYKYTQVQYTYASFQNLDDNLHNSGGLDLDVPLGRRTYLLAIKYIGFEYIVIHNQISSTEGLSKRRRMMDVRWEVKYIRCTCKEELDFSSYWVFFCFFDK